MCVTAQVELIGIGGFPHSEIVGSKLAHSSPTLIAACHVLHRLYVPRHPRIALTSRLRVHTTNDITGCLQRRSPTRQSSARWPLSGADDYNLSQIIYMMMSISGVSNRSSNPRCTEVPHEPPKQSSSPKSSTSRHRF